MKSAFHQKEEKTEGRAGRLLEWICFLYNTQGFFFSQNFIDMHHGNLSFLFFPPTNLYKLCLNREEAFFNRLERRLYQKLPSVCVCVWQVYMAGVCVCVYVAVGTQELGL